MNENVETPMDKAAEAAWHNLEDGTGGPFGAAITLNGKIIAIASNSVLGDHDPTAHAEVNAIRKAAASLGTHDLSGCVLYATGYPCPMCLSAIIWANISEAYYALDVEEAASIGFRDDDIYDFIASPDSSVLDLKKLDTESCHGLYGTYQSSNKTMY